MNSARARILTAAAGLALTVAVGICAPAWARSEPIADIGSADLPREGRDVLATLRAGGKLRYERDGVVFGNREKILPAQPRGYYHEYTVPTPGVNNRGARRIVCGGAKSAPQVCYYTADHYASFKRIRE